MIASYSKPASTFTIVRAVTAPSTAQNHYAVTVAPRYQLSRYGIETVPLTPYGAASALQNLSFTYNDASNIARTMPSTQVVDQSYLKLFGVGLEASLATVASGNADYFTVVSAVQSNVLAINNSKTVKGGTLPIYLSGRAVAVGDIVYTTANSNTIRRTVTGLLGATTAASVDALVNGSYNPAGSASNTYTTISYPVALASAGLTVTGGDTFKGNLVGALYNNGFGDLFTAVVTTGGSNTVAVLTITSQSGLFGGTITATASGGLFVFADTTGAVMGGLTATLDNTVTGASLTIGQTWTFSVKAKYTRLSTSQVVIAGTYTGAADTTLIIEVTTGTFNTTTPTSAGAVVRISDTAGLYTAANLTIAADNTAYAVLTSGLTIKFVVVGSTCLQNGLRKGDRYVVVCHAPSASTTLFDKVVLDGPAVDVTTFTDFTAHVGVEFRAGYTGEILATAAASGSAWTATNSNVAVASGLSLNVAARTSPWCPFVNAVGNLALKWRALIPATSGDPLYVIQTEADITSQLGPVDPDNDAAYAAHWLFSGAAGQQVYCKTVADVTAAAYTTALQAIERITYLRFVHVPSTDPLVWAALKSHVVTTSSPTVKAFREGFAGIASPGQYLLTRTVGSSPMVCTVGAYGGPNNLLVTCTNSTVDFTALGIVAGDLIEFPVLAAGVQYAIASVLSATEIILAAGPAAPISPAAQMTIWKANTAANQGSYVSAQAVTIGVPQMRLHWIEGAVDADNAAVEARYVAAEICGIRSAALVQQSLTRTVITSVAAAPAMYLRYRDTLLNTIASNGVTIISQDAPGSAVYIRHELTTDTTHGALNYEGMAVTNSHDIAAALSLLDESYVGVRNVTQQTLIDWQNDWIGELKNRTRADYDSKLGPGVLRFETPTITVDANLKDRATQSSKIYIPLPFNHPNGEALLNQDSTLVSITNTATA